MIGKSIAYLLEQVNGDCVKAGRTKGLPKYPAIVYAMSDSSRNLNLDKSQVKPGNSMAIFDVDVLAKSYKEAETIASQVFDLLHGWSGFAVDTNISLIEVYADATIFEDAESVWAFPFTVTVHY